MGGVQGDPDAIVIGSGPNGLVAGSVLARAGLNVLVLESNETRAGGAVGSDAATRPGFLHDVGAAFFPWAKLSRAFQSLPLEEHGLRWRRAPFDSCHPAPDGSYASIAGDHHVTAAHFGNAGDGERWGRIARWYSSIEPQVVGMLLDAFPALGPTARVGPVNLSRLTRVFLSRGRDLSERWFTSPAARRVLPGLALHADVGPDDRFGAALGFMLGMAAATSGYVVPEGGARSIGAALLGCLGGYGGKLRLGSRVARVVVSGGRARAVRLTNGEEIGARVVLADTDVAALLLDLVEREHVPSRVVRFMEHYPRGWGTFKVDWALDGPVPWSVATARESAVVHAGDSLDDLARFTAQVRRGELPDHPYLVIGQQSLLDPTRAPPGCHTLWAYSRVPPVVGGGWATQAERFGDRIDARIEALAPGFRARILARRVVSPDQLHTMDANLVGGDLGGGSNAWNRQLLFRPVFPYFRYRMPVKGLYLCSSYAHPGAGVHGMCGYNAAERVLKDLS
ncbi:MAG TPA: NAD(P)/FAD-dependent oxidoreductase [Gemmatimonadales bacterium]|nr:NAD(P)/FAD-dependent oxidoreductase [Gemmatimonadales bacterium]